MGAVGVRRLVLGFINPGGYGEGGMCVCFGCGGVGVCVGGVGGSGWAAWARVCEGEVVLCLCVCWESGLFVFMAGTCMC